MHQATRLWSELEAVKKVVMEPKGTGEAFDTVMTEYYDAIRAGRGGLFLAICRGKVKLESWAQRRILQ